MEKIQYTLQQLAEIISARCIGNESIVLSGIADLESARSDHVSFFAPNKYVSNRFEELLKHSQAGALIVPEGYFKEDGRNYLIHEDPSRAFQTILELFHPYAHVVSGFKGIHPTAVIHESAQIDATVIIGPNVVIDQGAVIGAKTQIGAGCSIGPYVKIGQDCLLHPQVVIRERCQVEDRVVIQPGAVIGSCGFGFTTDKEGRHTKLNQVGIVILENDVEIGANCTIDRARFGATVIGQGTKMDNLVQIGHGVKTGKHCLIVSQVGIAGSAEIGNYVVLGGKVAVNNHIKIGDQVMVAAYSGITKSISQAGKYSGIPAQPIHEHNRMSVHLRNIGQYVNELNQVKQELQELKKLCMTMAQMNKKEEK